MQHLTTVLAMCEQDKDGMTPLHYAASCEHEGMVELLVRSFTRYWCHVCQGLTGDVLAQVRSGAFVDIEDFDGDTPFTTASSPALQAIMADGPTSSTL